jgi:hypothetical protein
MARWCPFPLLSPLWACNKVIVIRFNVIKTLVLLFISQFVALYVKLDPGTHEGLHSVLPLNLGVTMPDPFAALQKSVC